MKSKTMNGVRDAYKELLFLIGNLSMGKRIRIGEKIARFLFKSALASRGGWQSVQSKK